jgi:hypothetical protein
MALSKLLARQLGKAFQINDLLERQGVQIRRRTHQAFIDQLLDALFTQALDVHRPTGHEVNDRLLELRAAGQTTDAAIDRAFADGLTAFTALDQLRALDMRTADRALLRDLHWPRVIRTTLE